MTYLTRLVLNPRHRAVQRDLADCQQLHRTVVNAFPRDPAGSPRDRWDILYRPEVDSRRGSLTVLLQSAIEPTWEHLPSAYLAPSTAVSSKPVDALYARIAEGQRLVFRLRANPTKRLPAGGHDRRDGPRVDLLREKDQLTWLARKGHQSGFELETARAAPGNEPFLAVQVQGSDKQRGWKRTQEQDKRSRLTFGSVLFEGELRVTEAALFRRALTEGIGSGKAYGFGLLSVAPARD